MYYVTCTYRNHMYTNERRIFSHKRLRMVVRWTATNRLGMERIITPYVYKSYRRANFGGKKKLENKNILTCGEQGFRGVCVRKVFCFRVKTTRIKYTNTYV